MDNALSFLAFYPVDLRLNEHLQISQWLLHLHLQSLQNRSVLLTNSCLFGLLCDCSKRQWFDNHLLSLFPIHLDYQQSVQPINNSNHPPMFDAKFEYISILIISMEQIRKSFPYLFLTIISLIILFISFSFLYLLIVDIQPWSNTATCIFVVLYLIIFLMLVWSIVEAVRTDPGRVPLQWGFFLETQAKKYCLICHVFKPERTHHCSVCGRCVLNMDHHCPWINTCIGFKNRKPFILMLIYTILATIINTITAICSLSSLKEAFESHQAGRITQAIVIVIALVLNLIILITIFNFLRFHLKLIFNNQTTIETLQLARQGKNPDQAESVYDLGKYYNWVQVFGTNTWTWFIPIFLQDEGPAGDGVIWPRRSSRS